MRAEDRVRVVGSLVECNEAADFYVKERCITAILEHREALDKMGVNPDAAFTDLSKTEQTGGSFWKW